MQETVVTSTAGTSPSLTPFPRTPRLDATVAFLSEGYEFVSNQCRALGTSAFETRLLGMKVIAMRGCDAAAFFYGGDGAFTRLGTIPPTTLRLLQDQGSVQQLDGAAHRVRKRMFLDLMSRESVARMGDLFEDEWRLALDDDWQHRERLVFHEAVRDVLTKAAARWIGVPPGEDLRKRRVEVSAMVDDAGSFGLSAVKALALRARSERWARSLVERVRSGAIVLAQDLPLAVVCAHRDEAGELLPVDVAAVEIINLLRPIVAISRFLVFSAMALHENPDEGRGLADSADGLHRFALEVRRLFPFFPAVGGRATRDLVFHGHPIDAGQLVLFDLYGSNHDPAIFTHPYAFQPARFLGNEPSPFEVVPQGAGHHSTDHRCPGEDITMSVMKRATRLLLTSMSYVVPAQDLTLDLTKLPTLPASGFVMSKVQPQRFRI